MDQQAPNPQEQIVVNGVSFSHKNIFDVVDDFYTRIQHDPILQTPFQSVSDWPEHINKLTHFWWIRLGGRPYLATDYNPVLKHYLAGFNSTLLQRWLQLFHATITDHLSMEQVNLWKSLSERIGEVLTIKNDVLKNEYEKRNLGKNDT